MKRNLTITTELSKQESTLEVHSANQVKKYSTHSIKETYKIIKGKNEDGKTMVNQYKIIKKLGQGSYGKVKLAVKQSTNEQFAIKIFKKSFLKRS